MQPEIRFHEIYRWAKEKAQGSHGVRCPALVLYSLQNRGGRDQLSAHQQHEGVQGVSPWHTTLLARYSVLYLPVRLTGKRRVSPDGNARFARQGNGQGFVPGRGQNPCLFPESGGRYTSPRPSSFVPRRAEISAPDDAPLRKNQRGRASTFGLARLDYPKARPGGGGQWRRT